MIEGPEDWVVFTDPDVFGEAVTYTPEGGSALQINALFTAAETIAASGPSGRGVSGVMPVLTIGETQLPSPPVAGDTVLARGVSYLVAQTQPDGMGLVRLILERN